MADRSLIDMLAAKVSKSGKAKDTAPKAPAEDAEETPAEDDGEDKKALVSKMFTAWDDHDEDAFSDALDGFIDLCTSK